MGIVDNFGNFGVAGKSATNGLVIGVGGGSAGVANLSGDDAIQSFENSLGAPKTTGAKDNSFSHFLAINFNDKELTQWRVSVGVNFSPVKTWPR